MCICNIVIILDHATYLGKEEAKDVKETVKFYRINEFQDLVGLRIVVSHCTRVSELEKEKRYLLRVLRVQHRLWMGNWYCNDKIYHV